MCCQIFLIPFILTTVLKKMLSKFTFYRKKDNKSLSTARFRSAPGEISLILLPEIGLPGFFANIAPLSSAFSGPSSSSSSSAFSDSSSSNTSSPSSGEASPGSGYSADASGIRVLAALESTEAVNQKSRNRIHSTPAPVLDSGSHPASRRPS